MSGEGGPISNTVAEQARGSAMAVEADGRTNGGPLPPRSGSDVRLGVALSLIAVAYIPACCFAAASAWLFLGGHYWLGLLVALVAAGFVPELKASGK